MTPADIKGKAVTVIGAARSGLAAARLLKRHGADVFVTDSSDVSTTVRKQISEENIPAEFGGHSPRANEADFFVVSPGVPDEAPFVASLITRQESLYSEVEVASWFCTAQVIAITGTNGKTTTTALTDHIFRTAGRRVTAAGNIGAPFSNFADQVDEDDVIVLEVSSFQLDHIDRMRPRVAVILNITPDHLDRYQNDFRRYAASKFRIHMNQKEGDAIIYNADDPTIRSGIADWLRPDVMGFAISTKDAVERGAFIRDGKIVLRVSDKEEVLMPHEELSLRGRHNVYNSLAASMAARYLEVTDDAIRESMRTFPGVPHRLELVRELDGVIYVNDSKATNVNAVWYALGSFDQPIVLIAGGVDKGNDYAEIASLVSDKVRVLITIGTGAPALEGALEPYIPSIRRAGSLEEAVRVAKQVANAGDVVLLSPACASLDMFDNYEHRGETFRRAVERL